MPDAAVGLRDRRTEEAELGHPVEHLAVDLALLVPFADERQDLRLDERARALLDEPVLVGEGEVDHDGMLRGRPRRRPTPDVADPAEPPEPPTRNQAPTTDPTRQERIRR